MTNHSLSSRVPCDAAGRRELQSRESRARRRNPWLAGVLSLPLAGLGHLYAGRLTCGVILIVAETVVVVALLGLLIAWDHGPLNVILLACVFVVWRLGVAVAAFRQTDRYSVTRGLPAWARWPGYAVVYVAVFAGSGTAVRAIAFEPFRVRGESMAQVLIPGDEVLATKWRLRALKRGDLVIVRRPDSMNSIKRVIALPGETVEVRARIVSIDGQQLVEPYLRPLVAKLKAIDFGPMAVPPRSYFVLGDNRDFSIDSRSAAFGMVHADDIVARPRTILWSEDPATERIRWGRVGQSLLRSK